MYSDEDGFATKQSQAAYTARMNILLSITALLSFLGFGAAILNGEYTLQNLQCKLSLITSVLFYCNKLLWASL